MLMCCSASCEVLVSLARESPLPASLPCTNVKPMRGHRLQHVMHCSASLCPSKQPTVAPRLTLAVLLCLI